MDSDLENWFTLGLFCNGDVENALGEVTGLVLLTDCTLVISRGADKGGLSGC